MSRADEIRAELPGELRRNAETCGPFVAVILDDAADTIEWLLAERDRLSERLQQIEETAQWYADNPERLAHEVDHALCAEILSLAVPSEDSVACNCAGRPGKCASNGHLLGCPAAVSPKEETK